MKVMDIELISPRPPSFQTEPLSFYFLDNSQSFESSLKVANRVTRTLLTWAAEASTQISSNGWLWLPRHQE